MGSKFIDFTPIQNLSLGSREEVQLFMATGIQQSFNVLLENRSLVVATMALLGENDAHTKNVGFTHNADGSLICAKVDHDSSDGMEDNNLKEALNNLTANSSGDVHSLIIKDIPGLIKALETIASIPDSTWNAAIVEAAESFRAHVPLSNDFAPEQTIAKFNQIKAAVPFYIDSLRWESAIMSSDVKEVSKLMLSGLNVHQNYCYANLPGHGSNLVTPLEMAIMAQSISMFEYLWTLSQPELSLQQTLLDACIKHNFQAGISFMTHRPDLLLSDAKHLELTLLDAKSSSAILEQTLLQMPNDLALPLTLLACREDAYKLLEQAGNFSCTQYVDHLSKVPGHCIGLRTYLINKKLPDSNCGGSHTYPHYAGQKMAYIAKGDPQLNDPQVEVGARNLFKLIANYEDIYKVNPNTLPAFVLEYIWEFETLFDNKINIQGECDFIDSFNYKLSTFKECGFVDWYQHRAFGKTFCILHDALALSMIDSGQIDGAKISKALIRSFENPNCHITDLSNLFQTRAGENVLKSIDKSGQKLSINPFLTHDEPMTIDAANISHAVKLFVKQPENVYTVPIFLEDESCSYFWKEAQVKTPIDAITACNSDHELDATAPSYMALINDERISIATCETGTALIINDHQIKMIVCSGITLSNSAFDY